MISHLLDTDMLTLFQYGHQKSAPADLTRDAESNNPVRLRSLLAFRHHLIAAVLKCPRGFFGSLIPILETRPAAQSPFGLTAVRKYANNDRRRLGCPKLGWSFTRRRTGPFPSWNGSNVSRKRPSINAASSWSSFGT